MNCTKAGFQNNVEELLVSTEEAYIHRKLVHFEKMWELARPLKPEIIAAACAKKTAKHEEKVKAKLTSRPKSEIERSQSEASSSTMRSASECSAPSNGC